MSTGEVILCPAGCGMYLTQKDVESGQNTTLAQKEQEGDTIHEPIHLDSKILHSDEVLCRAGSILCFNQDDDEVRHQNTQVEKELVMEGKEPEESYTEPCETPFSTCSGDDFKFSDWVQLFCIWADH